MQTDRVSWNMKPGRSNLSEKGRKKMFACAMVSKLGRRRRSTKKVGDGEEAQNLARRMQITLRRVETRKRNRNRKVFSQGRNVEKHSLHSYHIADENHIYRMDYCRWTGFVCTDNPANIRKIM